MNVYYLYFQLVVVSLDQFVVNFVFVEQRLCFGSGSELLSITDVELEPLVLHFTVSIFIESTALRV